jgi:hypothetical protein
VDLCALAIPAHRLDQATARDPADAGDRAERDRYQIEREYGTDREMRTQMAEDVARSVELLP